MLGDWKCACTSRTLVDSALAGSQAFASFFSAPLSFDDSGNATTSTTTQKPTTTHLVQLPAGISAILLSLLIASPAPVRRWPHGSPLRNHWSQRGARARQAAPDKAARNGLPCARPRWQASSGYSWEVFHGG